MDIYEVKINCDSTTLLYAIIHQVILKKVSVRPHYDVQIGCMIFSNQ